MSTKEGKGGTGKASVKKAVSSSTKAGLQDLKKGINYYFVIYLYIYYSSVIWLIVYWL